VKLRIVLLGPPASGKGTQAELMQARYQLPITSPGAILREELKLGTAIGIEAERQTSQGKLVSDPLVNSVVKSWLDRHERQFVFDGYPRSIGQAIALEQMLSERSMPIEIVISMNADFCTIGERVSKRIMCTACGSILSIGLHVASAEADCPKCGGKLARRLDDTPETLELRMREFEEKTEPLIGYFGERGLLRNVDATRAPEVVFRSITELLEAA